MSTDYNADSRTPISRALLELSESDPRAFLEQINQINPLAAVLVANTWGGTKCTPQQLNAAWEFIQTQTAAPLCISCGWAIANNDPHTYCEELILQEAQEKVDESSEVEDDFDDHHTDYYDSSDDDQGDDGCPHCGSHTCNTWDCQQ